MENLLFLGVPILKHIRVGSWLVICCPIYHWLEVSCEIIISQVRSVSGVLFTDDRPTANDILSNKSLVSKTLFRFLHA